MYDPIIGRWLEEDPTGFDAGDMDLYRLEGNNPTNEVDPSGLEWQRIGGKPVTIKDNKFKFGEGEGIVSVWIDATVFNPKNEKTLRDMIYLQFTSTKDSE